MSASKTTLLRCGTQFAHTCAYDERVNAAQLYCCDCAAERKHAVSRRHIRGLSLKITTLSYRSPRKKDFTERFFAKRSGERFKRGVRRSRPARKVRSAATTSV